MFDLEKDVPVPGTKWTLGRWTYGMLEEFGLWLRSAVPDPYAHLEKFIDRIPPDAAAAELAEAKAVARQLANPTLECPLVKEVLGTSAGVVQFLWLRLRAFHPDATKEDAFRVAVVAGGLEARRAAAEAAAGKDGPGGESPPPPPA